MLHIIHPHALFVAVDEDEDATLLQHLIDAVRVPDADALTRLHVALLEVDGVGVGVGVEENFEEYLDEDDDDGDRDDDDDVERDGDDDDDDDDDEIKRDGDADGVEDEGFVVGTEGVLDFNNTEGVV
jgi:hypothetical protein